MPTPQRTRIERADAIRTAIGAGCLVVILFAVYAGVLRNGFVDYDDNEYLFENAIVQQGLTLEGVRWAFTSAPSAKWHPLTWLSHMLDCQLFGLEPGWHEMGRQGLPDVAESDVSNARAHAASPRVRERIHCHAQASSMLASSDASEAGAAR